ncbi:patr class I histocompatibility antigen, A-126 alpha chain-like [Garra rufa]|uniref:patr class I histocompatibility antigen, A-126 alpha chain-like n=1 Tax=Garra rufa TaxID=137080 RepID=UPI003CCE8DCD
MESLEDTPQPPRSPQYEELVEVLTHAVAKLNISWPAEQHHEPQGNLHKEISRSWGKPYSFRLYNPTESYANVGGTEEYGYRAMPRLTQLGPTSLCWLGIVGQTPFPEFSVVVMLDDLQLLYYDSTTWIPVYRSYSDSKYYDEERSDAGVVFRDMFYDMKDRAFYLKEHQNHTDGQHVDQRLVGCELLSSNKAGPLHYWDAFGGQNMEEFIFDIGKHAIQIKMPCMITWDQLKRVHENFMYENVYLPICIKTLRRYLTMEKNNVLRKVKPRVRLMKKMLPDSQELQISCLATGFYPRHINLTLFRDGQPVDDIQLDC